MKNFQENLNNAKNLHKSGKINKAINIYKKLLKFDNSDAQIYYLIGTAFLQKKNYVESINYLNQAISIRKDIPVYFNNLGIALSQLNQNEDALKNYKKALELKPDLIDAIINSGIAYKKLFKYKQAIKYFDKSLKIDPNNYLLLNNIGNLYKSLGDTEEAHKFYDRALKIKDDYCDSINNKAELYLQKKDFKKALVYFEKVIKINPKFTYALGKLIHAKKHLCDWSDYDLNLDKVLNGINNKETIIEPFPMLSLIDDPDLQLKNAIIYNNLEFKKYNYEDNNLKSIKSKKIRIGYYGAEFFNHPVLQLTKDIFKSHDKSKFEIYGFFHGPVKDKMHFEIQKYFKKFFDINNNSIEEVVELSRSLKINIAINLTGHTADSKNSIYLSRVAPVQISFVGYSGTMGTNFMDYIIGDKFLIPKKNYKFYTEKVLNMPNCFFPGPNKINVSEKKFSRKTVNLPEESFVFGSFNNSYKITPEIFTAWMNILKLTNKSVLWLLDNNQIASNNLINEAKRQGVETSRIIFAEKVYYDEHLKRFELMDLSLDTFPYNGHTTTSEAIRSGVPTITMAGNSFTSRVAGSLLNGIGLNELISTNIKEYISLACELASNKSKYQSIKKKLEENSKILFDSEKYTKDLENIYENLVL